MALFSPSLSAVQGTNLSPAKVRHEITEFNGATISNHDIVKYQILLFLGNSTKIKQTISKHDQYITSSFNHARGLRH